MYTVYTMCVQGFKRERQRTDGRTDGGAIETIESEREESEERNGGGGGG